MSLILEPLIPAALWGALAALAAGLLVWYGRASRSRLALGRWRWMLFWMGLGLALPLAILLNPTWVERLPPPEGKPLLTLLVDRSVSMATADAGSSRTRFAVATAAAADVARQLGSAFDVKVKSFAEATSEVAANELSKVTPNGQASDLALAVEDALAEERPAGQAVLLLSDGIHNVGGTGRLLRSAERAKSLSSPVYAYALGGPVEQHDLELRAPSPQELAFAKQQVVLPVLVRQQGFAGQAVTVALRCDDKQIAEQRATLGPDGSQEISFTVAQDAGGLYRYEAAVTGLPGEASEANNAATILLRVVDQPVRVLLLEGKPYWDTKFLVRTLAADPALELVTVVQMAEGRLLERTLRRSEATASAAPALSAPATPREGKPAEENGAGQSAASTATDAPIVAKSDQWRILKSASHVLGEEGGLDSFQIVVLGRDADVFLDADSLARLRRWLSRQGGALVCFRGAPAVQVNQGLAQLLPVRWAPGRESRFHVQWTERGQELHWTGGEGAAAESLDFLPTLAAGAEVQEPKPLAVVLATQTSAGAGAARPAVSYQPYGTGRVVVVEGAGMWRWAFLNPQFQAHDKIYGRLWHSLVRWLVSQASLLPGQSLALRSDRVSYSDADPATLTLLVRDEAAVGPPPQIELLDRESQVLQTQQATPASDEPGVFRVSFGKLPEGQYRARATGDLPAGEAPSAAFDVRKNVREPLELSARPELLEQLAKACGGALLSDADLAGFGDRLKLDRERSQSVRLRRTAAWDRWWVLTGVLAAWAAAWGIRRASGLV